jgi:hypothetical protein
MSETDQGKMQIPMRQASRRAIKAGLQLAVSEYEANDEDFKLIGATLYAISSEDPKEAFLALNKDIGDEIVTKGWRYYDSIADSDGDLDLDAFQRLFNAYVGMLFDVFNIGDAAVDMMRKVGAVLDWTPSPDVESDFRAELRHKTENAFPVIAEALFRFFGHNFALCFEAYAQGLSSCSTLQMWITTARYRAVRSTRA